MKSSFGVMQLRQTHSILIIQNAASGAICSSDRETITSHFEKNLAHAFKNSFPI